MINDEKSIQQAEQFQIFMRSLCKKLFFSSFSHTKLFKKKNVTCEIW